MSTYCDPLEPANRGVILRYLTSALNRDVNRLSGDPEPTRGGVENRNYVLNAVIDGQTRRYILRCPPAEIPVWRSRDGLYDLEREFRVLQELQPFHIGAPQAYGYDGGDALGVPCFLMDALEGTPLTDHLIPQPDTNFLHEFAERLVAISQLDYQRSDWLREHLPRWTNDWWLGWFDALLNPELKDELSERAVHWLKAKLPPKRELVFAHGDANPGNFLVSNDQISGIVDWEFAGLSDDPLNEIGFFVWLYDGQLAKPLAQEYSELLKRDIKDTKWYFVRSWIGITYLGTDPKSELFKMRRDVLAQLIS